MREGVEDYLGRAKRNEQIFINLLEFFNKYIIGKEIFYNKEHWDMRKKPCFEGDFKRIPNLNLESKIEKVYEEFSCGSRLGKWTIMDFRIGDYKKEKSEEEKLLEKKFHYKRRLELQPDEAILKIKYPSGTKRTDIYRIGEDGSVTIEDSGNVYYSVPSKKSEGAKP